MSTPRRHWGPVRSLLCLAPFLVGVSYLAYKENYGKSWHNLTSLPEPITELIDPITGLPQLSEARILAHAQYLSEDIGYRTVGTREHALGDEWMVQQVEVLQAQCEEVIRAYPGRHLQCEVWHQRGDGYHRFDIMGHRLYKTYRDLTNVVMRISDGTEAGKTHAVLVNAHVDSTLPSPGAADDALAVGVMLECIRVLVGTPGWEPTHAIVFLFNNAEESLQDGSHLFSTQHPIANTVRAAINLEAAGTTGRTLLFQATSEQMIQTYAKVPRPFGTVIANEIFSSGILMSDTDFRQFEEYLNVTGLDIAVVGNSYLYHTRLDIVENIEPGVAQHMADNTLALLLELSSSDSVLPTLTAGYSRPTTVFFSYFGQFINYSFSTASAMYTGLFVASLVLVYFTYVDPAPALKQRKSPIAEQLKGMVAVAMGFLGAVLGANVVAFLMRSVFGKALSWFSVELSCIALYGPAALAGALASQLFVGRVREQTVFKSVFLLQAFLAILLQSLGVGSAAVFFLSALPLSASLIFNAFLNNFEDNVSLLTYVLGQFTPISLGTQIFCGTLDVFVPLTGRMGKDAPAEHIIATIVAFCGAYTLPLVLPFVHRYSRALLIRSVLLVTLLTAAVMLYFSLKSPFDTMHPKRLYVLHVENTTSLEQHLHIGAADGAPGFDELAKGVAQRFSVPGVAPKPVTMDEYNGDWDILYPFSAFVTPYKFEMPLKPEYLDPLDRTLKVSAANDTVDRAARTRSLTLVVEHPGVIWTTIAFDAHVLEWTLDKNPPDGFARHHVKEASFYGHNRWAMDLVIKLPGDSDVSEVPKLKVNFVGVHERAMWPGKKAEKEIGGHAMQLFEEFDTWVSDYSSGTVDVMLLGCVGGVADI
ncbi:hypothetical protein CERSUDRAFT_104381 [Gelatoporia subvermispora B]|uniref:Peptide hydrolase n=1 Tax=Ceriporiopsis subvermispora (strain B) TaxID=914234 RepID=M2RJX8_CERS8|nr:hypothetical protein CERSUDRAFT_104381 [Gelatoporia subvermispora B]